MRSAPARVLLRGGSVYSPASPFATALFVADGKVAWVGEDEASARYVDSADLVVDLDGRLVTPGFVDAHAHIGQTGMALVSVDLTRTSSLAEALAEVETFARWHTGAVLFAHGWDESRWPEGRPPTMAEVDRAVGARPAYVSRIDGHCAVVSTGLAERTPGLTALDGWEGAGLVKRVAHHAARDASAALTSTADRREAIRRALRLAASRGITSLHELNAAHISPVSDLGLISEVTAEETLPEVVPYWGGLMGAGLEPPDHVVAGFAGDVSVDGSIGSHTACLHEPYADSATTGNLYLDTAAVRDHVVFCTKQDTQAGFHVIGDRAMQTVVQGFAAAAELVGDGELIGARHRLEHVEMIEADQIAALARWGVVASVQPAFDAFWGGGGALYERRLGAGRARAMNPFGSLHRAGMVLAFGSDSPVTPFDPWGGVQAAVFHHDEAERLTVRAAFNAHTRGGHRARRVDDAGVLAPGADATYAVWETSAELTVQAPDERLAAWSTDPRAGVPVLPDLHPGQPLPSCLQTVVAGTPVFAVEDAL